MTKLSYYLCTAQDGKEHFFYGTSKKEMELIGTKVGLGVFKTIKELTLAEMSKTHDARKLEQVREKSKPNWSRMPIPKKSKVKASTSKEAKDVKKV